MDVSKWAKMERILDLYRIKPIFGIIPCNRDESLISTYTKNTDFWDLVHQWIKKGWTPAMHGYEHRYVTHSGGINPVNNQSEFACLPLEEQAIKIKAGYELMLMHSVYPEIFFAPSHTFDANTLKAIREETPIRVISDTIAIDIYKEKDFFFIPQQCGAFRKLPFRVITGCYHPNTMGEHDFLSLELFLKNNRDFFISFEEIELKNRSFSLVDRFVRNLYFLRRQLRKSVRSIDFIPPGRKLPDSNKSF